MDSCHKQNYCKLGIKALIAPVINGHRPIEELTTENFCLCTNTQKHTWLCSCNFHGRNVKLSYTDVHKIVKRYYKQIRKRVLLPAEATRLVPRLIEEPAWVFSFYPVIKSSCFYEEAVKNAAAFAFSDPFLCEQLVQLGVSRKKVPGICNDATEYFSFLMVKKTGSSVKFDKLGKFSWQYLDALREALSKLPLELIVDIFEIAYNCKLTSRCLQLYSSRCT